MEQHLNKKVLAIRLALMYAVSIALLIIIFSAFVRPEPRVIVREEIRERPAEKSMDTLAQSAKARVLDLEQQLASANQQLSLVKQQAATPAKKGDDQALKTLQQQIQQRDQQLTALQKQLSNRNPTTQDDRLVSKLKSEIAQKDKLIAQLRTQTQTDVISKSSGSGTAAIKDLERRNENLVKGFNSLQTQMGLMTKNYNLAKAEVNRLNEQLRAKN